MHKITITVDDANPDDLLGLKEAYAMVTEVAGRVARVDVQQVEVREADAQMRMEGT